MVAPYYVGIDSFTNRLVNITKCLNMSLHFAWLYTEDGSSQFNTEVTPSNGVNGDAGGEKGIKS